MFLKVALTTMRALPTWLAKVKHGAILQAAPLYETGVPASGISSSGAIFIFELQPCRKRRGAFAWRE
jgi:hypothetical protein